MTEEREGGRRGSERALRDIRESNELFFPRCLLFKGTRHATYCEGEEEGRGAGRRGRMEISAGRRPLLPLLPARTVACKSSLVHFLLSSTLFRHYSSPRTISNPDRRRLPSLFLLFMVKFIGSSALLPFLPRR